MNSRKLTLTTLTRLNRNAVPSARVSCRKKRKLRDHFGRSEAAVDEFTRIKNTRSFFPELRCTVFRAAQEDSDASEDRSRCFARCYHVFNASQVDGYAPRVVDPLPESMRIENADRFFASLPAVIKYGGDQAFYSPTGDFIQMPPFAQFKSPEGYVCTIAHEFGHWSGAPSRLNRDLTGRFGDERYCMEELCAELTSCFLCADLQIQSEPRFDHAP